MKYALISGACSGLAQVVIQSLKDDYIIFALDINPFVHELYKNGVNIHSFTCDITDSSQIEKTKIEISKSTSSLDVIINFAGIVELGSVIEISPAKFEKSMQVNVIGNYKINYAFFPLIKAGRGRFIIVSSEYGKLLGLPFHSFYTVSKHALEMYADSLRREVQCLGIKVIKIRPGSFKTEMVANIQKQFTTLVKETALFKRPITKMEFLMIGEIRNAREPQRIVNVFNKAINKKNPRIVYHVHNSLKMKMLNMLPSRLQDWILDRYFPNNN
ncbi:MAG: SDR family NAD(P)-dependent oxidoreductase [Bacilli bacterium]